MLLHLIYVGIGNTLILTKAVVLIPTVVFALFNLYWAFENQPYFNFNINQYTYFYMYIFILSHRPFQLKGFLLKYNKI